MAKSFEEVPKCLYLFFLSRSSASSARSVFHCGAVRQPDAVRVHRYHGTVAGAEWGGAAVDVRHISRYCAQLCGDNGVDHQHDWLGERTDCAVDGSVCDRRT